MKGWPDGTVERLKNKQILPGDDVFKIVYSLGPPERIIWDNDFKLLIYKNGLVCKIHDGVLTATKTCEHCCEMIPLEDRRTTLRYDDLFKFGKNTVIF